MGYSENADATSCYATGDVEGYGDNVGGLVGFIDGSSTIASCYATGGVVGNSDVGGFAGRMDESSTATLCYATGDIRGNANLGGFVGSAVGALTSCYATGFVVGSGDVGGLVGDATGSVTSCYATGNVEGTIDVGGLVGYSEASLTGCYATGFVVGIGDVGGLVGDARGAITSCYATGDIEGTNNIGGLVGDIASNTSVTASYYDNTSTLKGIGSLEDSDQLQVAVSKTTSELQSPTDYSDIYADWNAGGDLWDFLGANRYPKLKADWNGDDRATAAEFGPQMLVFVDERGAELRQSVFRIPEHTTGGSLVGTFPLAINVANNTSATVVFVGTSDEFDLSDGSTP